MGKRLALTVGTAVLTAAGLAVAAAVAALPAAAAPAAPAAPAAADTTAAVLAAMQRDLGLDAAQARARIAAEQAATGTADRLRAELGATFAGYWLDDGEPVVAVTDQTEVARIEAAGARAELAERSADQLAAARAELDRAGETAPDGVTSWYVDPADNTVVITATDPVAAEEFAAAAGVGDAVRIERVDGRAELTQGGLAAGEVIHGDARVACSAGFVVTDGLDRYLLTSGHCTVGASNWTTRDGTPAGTTVATNFPGTDFGAILVDNGALTTSNSVFRQFPVTGAGVAAQGSVTCTGGAVSGLTCGAVTATGVTLSFDDGIVLFGVTETDACTQAGDSGSPVLSGSTAVGLHSASRGCGEGGGSYFQPIGQAMTTYGVALAP